MSDRLNVLLHEYDALRSEVTARCVAGFQIVSIAVASAAFVWQLQGRSFWLLFTFAAAVIVGSVGYNSRDINKLSRRLQEIEKQVDAEIGGWYVLRWERLWGGLATNYWLNSKEKSVPSEPKKTLDVGTKDLLE